MQDKDTSKFDMALKQTLDSIRARAAWVKVCVYLAMVDYLTDTLDVAFHCGVDSMVGQAQFEALVPVIPQSCCSDAMESSTSQT